MTAASVMKRRFAPHRYRKESKRHWSDPPAEFDTGDAGAKWVGNQVDQTKLVYCLRRGSIGGACLDEFETKPVPAKCIQWTVECAVDAAHCGRDSVEVALQGRRYEYRGVYGEATDAGVDSINGFSYSSQHGLPLICVGRSSPMAGFGG